jgi:hypothetical protein
MRFQEAKNRFHNSPIRYPERGRALGRATYLKKIDERKYEVWTLIPAYERNDDDDWVRKDRPVSLFTIEPYGVNSPIESLTLITVTNTEYNDLKVSVRIGRWINIFTRIRDSELRFNLTYSTVKTLHSMPALTQGVQFLVNSFGKVSLKEGQVLRTSQRFINKEKAKPVKERLEKLTKFGKLLTQMDTFTYGDLRTMKSKIYMTDIHKVMAGEIEPNMASVCDLIWANPWLRGKRDAPETKIIPKQANLFLSSIEKNKRLLFKKANVYEAKEYDFE